MSSAIEILNRQFLEMRWRCLSLAADLDRIERAAGGTELAKSDTRLHELREAIAVLLTNGVSRAEKVQTIFSDKTK
jgi:hypothetical protein